MASRVFHLPGDASKLAETLPQLWAAAGFSSMVPDGGFVAVKLHFGEPGSKDRTVRPACVRSLVEQVRAGNGRPFLTDTNVLYRGLRHYGDTHLACALENGYTMEAAGAPVVIADGMNGESLAEVEVAGKHLKKVRLGAAIARADAILVLTHVTGHPGFGLGATLKNVGMGAAGPGTKQMLHAVVRPRVNREKCGSCGRCIEECPEGAVSLDADGKAVIDLDKCIGCGECVGYCSAGAIPIDWGESQGLQERTVEVVAALARDKPGRMAYVNFLTHVSGDCDCMNKPSAPICADLGAMASFDPVALDQASCDAVNAAQGLGKRLPGDARAEGTDKFRALYPKVDWSISMQVAEEMGIGTREYELVEVDG